MILTGRYPPASRLKEEELAALTGASRTPIREALLRLQGEGLVEFKSHRGALVASWESEDVDAVFELRALLEGFGARKAARVIGEQDLATLRELAAEMDAAVAEGSPERLDEVAVLNNKFHRTIFDLGSNDRLADVQRALVQLPLVQRTFRRYTPVERLRSMAYHAELIDALAVGDEEWAEAAMRSHVLSARHVALRRAADEL